MIHVEFAQNKILRENPVLKCVEMAKDSTKMAWQWQKDGMGALILSVLSGLVH